MSAVQVLLLQRAENLEHADRAWQRMLDWTPVWVPSELDAQVHQALRLTATGADPAELCAYDEVHLRRAAQEKAEREGLTGFLRRFRR